VVTGASAPLVEEQQVQLAQRLTRDAGPAAEVMTEGRDEHEVLVEQREFDDPGYPEGHGEQQQVEPSGRQPFQQVRGLLLVHLEIEVRVPVVHQPQHGRQQIRRDGRDDPEPQRPGEGGPHGLRLLHERPDLLQHRPRPYGQPLTGGREEHLAGRALQECDAEGLLQRGDGAGQGGLAHADRGGGVPEVEVLGDRGEGAQLGQAGLASLTRITYGH
jgi:hypothetical protein